MRVPLFCWVPFLLERCIARILGGSGSGFRSRAEAWQRYPRTIPPLNSRIVDAPVHQLRLDRIRAIAHIELLIANAYGATAPSYLVRFSQVCPDNRPDDTFGPNYSIAGVVDTISA